MKNTDEKENSKSVYKNTISKEALLFNAKVDDKVKKVTVDVLRINKATEKLRKSIDEFHGVLSQKNPDFEKQKVIIGKLEALKRLAYATKLGLERQKLKLYDIDSYAVREDVVNKGLD